MLKATRRRRAKAATFLELIEQALARLKAERARG